MKRWYVHGTSYESAISMTKGEKRKTHRTWNCSDYDKIYVRCISKEDINSNNLVEMFYSESYRDFVYDMLKQAIGNANITAASQNSQNKKVALMFFQIDDELIEVDYSCPGMDNCFSFHEDKFKEVYQFTVYCDAYIPLYRIMYLKEANNEYLNLDNIAVDSYEETLMKSISDDSLIFSEIINTEEDALWYSGAVNYFMQKRKDDVNDKISKKLKKEANL